MRPHSGIPKKVREANLRRERNKERRFNEPLRIFLERKHPEVLHEFKQLFISIDERNPGRKNLSLINTEDFKLWMLNNPPVPIPQPPLLPSPQDCCVNGQPQDCTLTPLQPLLEIPLLPSPQDCCVNGQPQDILDLTCREIFDPIEEPLSIEDIPEAIINELMEDQFLSELLNGYVDVSNFSRGSQCILGSLGGKQSCFCITVL